jgi:hypothetical protein
MSTSMITEQIKTNGSGQEDLVLTVYTNHQADFEAPPGIVKHGNDGTYVGYFENRFGELYVVSIDLQSKTGWLAGHETAWERLPIKDGRLSADFVLAPDEAQWLRACWRAATEQELELPETDAIRAWEAAEERRRRAVAACWRGTRPGA